MPLLHCRIQGRICCTAEFEAKPEQRFIQKKLNSKPCTYRATIHLLPTLLIAIKNIKRSSFLHALIAIKTKNAKSAAYLRNDLVFMYTTRVAHCTGLYKATTSRRNSAIQFTKMENN